MSTQALRFEHIFRDADLQRYKAVEMTRARDAFITAQETDVQRAIESACTYENMLARTIHTLHERAQRTSLEHQPCFEWKIHETSYQSPCWYFEWISLLCTKYMLQRDKAVALFEEQKYQEAKDELVRAVDTCTRAKDILQTQWVWRAPNSPKWCKTTWWDAQREETHAMRALSIYLHCEHMDGATMQQLYGAISKAEEYATQAACLWPSKVSLEAIENTRVKKAWCKAHLLWAEEQYGAAIGLAKAWSGVKYNMLKGMTPTEWSSIIHDWSHENNTVHYQKITTPTSI